jgi:hypothetical protein
MACSLGQCRWASEVLVSIESRSQRFVRDGIACQSHHLFTATGIQISAASLEPRWGIGISADNVLTLCFSKGEPDALVHAGTLL